MTVIYLLTVLFLKEADTYSYSVILNAFKDKAACLERLDGHELVYRREEEKYVLERYTRENYNGSKYVQGFSIKNKESKHTSFFQCQSTFLLDE